MTTKNFNVKNGLTTGNITLDATTSNISTLGNILANGNITGNYLTVNADISTNTIGVTGNITSGNANLGNLATANYFSGNGHSITGLPLANLSDVSLTSPTTSQILSYNGAYWVNTNNTGSVSAGSGVGFWFSTPVINSTDANNAIQIDSLQTTPNTAATTYADLSINGTAAICAMVSAPLGRTVFDAGNWEFSVWANVSSTSGTTTINVGVHEVVVNADTITVSGTGTTRTVTATSGTPFATVVPGSDVVLSSYLQTPKGIYRITAKTSDSVVSIDTPTGYVNDVTVAASVWTPLFNIQSSVLNNTAFAEYLFGTTEPAYNVSTDSAIGVIMTGATTGGGSKHIYITINGTTTASHFSTPLHTLHDNLAGLQGGSANEYYHLTNTEYIGTGTGVFARKTNAELTTPNIGAATGTSLGLTANLTAANANLGNAATANFFIGSGNNLSNLQAANISGTVANANYSAYAGNVTGAGQSNITTVGTLTNLSVSGNTIIGGNLIVSGTTTTVNSTTTRIIDPIVELGGGANGAALSTDDNKDRGQILHYYSGSAPVDAFIGWDDSNAEFSFGSNVTVSSEVITFNTLGNVRANCFIGDGSQLTNIPASAVGAATANNITLGTAVDGNLSSPGSISTWTESTKVTEAIDDLNEALDNIRANTYVKSVSFTGTPTAAGSGTLVTLTITSVGNPNRYDITWGDGTYSNNSSSASPTHTYATNIDSPFSVTVRAYNTSGSGTGSEASFTRTDYITIYTTDPVMGFGLYRGSTGGTALTGSTLYVSEGETLYLENTTTNTSMATVSYTINWGDGNTDTITGDGSAGGVGGGRKSHTYATGQHSGTGTKTITLTLTAHSTANPASIPRNTTSAIKIYNPSITAPNGLSSKTITFQASVGTNPYLAASFANNIGGSTTVAVGASVNRVTTSTPIETVTMTTYAYNADSGYLTAVINGNEAGNIALSSGSQVGTDGSLSLVAESDYNLLDATGASTSFGLSIYSPTLFKGFTAKVSATNSGLSVGVNNFKLNHSSTGATNIIEFAKDDVTSAPTIDLTSATLAASTNGTYRYISGIPYYNTGSPTITLSGTKIYDWIGQTYQNTSTPFQIEADTNYESTSGNVLSSQTKTYSQLDGTSTYLSGGIPIANTGKTSGSKYTIGDQTISINGSGVASVQTIKVRATNVNGTSTYATPSTKVQIFTASPSGFVEDNISVTSTSTLWNDNAKRIVISSASGATPAYVGGTNYYTSSYWTGAQTIAGTDEAVVRFNQLTKFSTDLSSGYLPVGPDLATGRSGTQYFRGAFRRNAKSSITVTITGKISGLYIAAPGTTIDSTSTLNGWLNASLAYNGAGIPGANTGAGGNGTNGCAVGTNVPTGTVLSAATYTLTLGTVSTSTSTGNQILFSIALAAGDYITSWSFG